MSQAPSSPSHDTAHLHRGGEGQGSSRSTVCHCVSNVWPPMGDPRVTAVLAIYPVC